MNRNSERIRISDECLVIPDIRDFNPDQIFDCGQCFRWEKNSAGLWQGIAGGRRAAVEYDGTGMLKIEDSLLRAGGCTRDEALKYWRNYFDLDRDYGAIKKKLAEGDPVMSEAISYGSGIRILRQEPWETLVSFIISQNNNIPRIKKCIEALAETLGEDGNLPAPRVLAKADIGDLAGCRLGYRDRYLIEAAGQYLMWGMPETARELQQFSGVGPKVANCIALFGLGLVDSFPIDVWMRRVMSSLYGFEENDIKGMAAFAGEKFAPYGGIAQQYLFYFITHKGVDKGGK
ncbi:MAG: DNA-3-methyladenine glycosylase family protein [Lentihominibacter sp.]